MPFPSLEDRKMTMLHTWGEAGACNVRGALGSDEV